MKFSRNLLSYHVKCFELNLYGKTKKNTQLTLNGNMEITFNATHYGSKLLKLNNKVSNHFTRNIRTSIFKKKTLCKV